MREEGPHDCEGRGVQGRVELASSLLGVPGCRGRSRNPAAEHPLQALLHLSALCPAPSPLTAHGTALRDHHVGPMFACSLSPQNRCSRGWAGGPPVSLGQGQYPA